MQRDMHEELSSDFQCQVTRNCWLVMVQFIVQFVRRDRMFSEF